MKKSEFIRNIILDLDGTLFDYLEFCKNLAPIFQRFGSIDFDKTYPEAFDENGIYSFEKHLSFISSEHKRENVKRAVEIVFLGIQKFLFPDVILFLKEFENDTLILLTRGELSFQMRKIKNLNSRISSLFSHESCIQTKKEEFLEVLLEKFRASQTFFIDDDGQELIDVKARLPRVKTIFINRYGGERFTMPCSVDCAASNLKEAGDYIDSLDPRRVYKLSGHTIEF